MSQDIELTGGDGRPRKRSAAAAEYVFLLHSAYKEYLSGNHAQLPPTHDEKNGCETFLAFGCFGVIVSSFTLIFNMNKTEFALMFILCGLVALWFGVKWFFLSRQRRRLSKSGKLLIGQISDIKAEWKNKGPHYSYHVTVNYKVMTPTGGIINSSDTAIYMDLVGKPLPERGTPVAVLYLRDEDKMLL